MSAASRYAAALTAIAFALHVAWEYAQCELFFVHLALPPTHATMLAAAGIDVLMTWTAYGAVALASRRWLWALERWTLCQWLVMVVVALSFAFAIEAYALETRQWAYTAGAPRVPGTSVSLLPVAQLLVLFPLSFALARAAHDALA